MPYHGDVVGRTRPYLGARDENARVRFDADPVATPKRDRRRLRAASVVGASGAAGALLASSEGTSVLDDGKPRWLGDPPGRTARLAS